MVDDWRIRDQEEYLKGVVLVHKKFKSNISSIANSNYDPRYYNDHEHCIFCWHKFMEDCHGIEDCSSEGYCTEDGKYWVCDKCFSDFRDKFKWKVNSD